MRIGWVCGGEPFDLRFDMFSPEDQRVIKKAYTHAKVEAMRALQGLDESDRAELEEDVMMDAMIEAGRTMVRRALMRVDPDVRSLSEEEVLDRLTSEEFVGVMKAIKPEAKGDSAPRRQASKTTTR